MHGVLSTGLCVCKSVIVSVYGLNDKTIMNLLCRGQNL